VCRATRRPARRRHAIVAAVAAALADAELTIDELSAEVAARTGHWAADPVVPAFGGMWPRWRQVMHLAAHRGALCFGPNRGRKVTYTSPRRWLPGFQPAWASDALPAGRRRPADRRVAAEPLQDRHRPTAGDCSTTR